MHLRAVRGVGDERAVQTVFLLFRLTKLERLDRGKARRPDSVEGGFLEAGTLVETAAWDVLSRLNGKSNVHITYIPTGIHAWNTWIRAAFTEQKLYWQFNQF